MERHWTHDFSAVSRTGGLSRLSPTFGLISFPSCGGPGRIGPYMHWEPHALSTQTRASVRPRPSRPAPFVFTPVEHHQGFT
jgi:hypothetical protein